MSAKESILKSIREHLRTSVPHDLVHAEGEHSHNGRRSAAAVHAQDDGRESLIEIFGRNLEAVGGHCILARNDTDVVEALNGIIAALQDSPLRGRTIALSNANGLEQLIARIEVAVEKIVVSPSGAELFDFDVGISTVQAAIAETGTLMLDSEAERHRLVSLIPPVHIAIVDAANIRLTLGEALASATNGTEVSPTITFITGPSRTADIELTLAIGVHGPQELYVIINEKGD